MFQKRKINLLFFVLPVVIIASLATIIIVYAWIEPAQAPPNGNVSAPLNVSNIGQSKIGGLVLNTGIPGATYGLIVDKGNVGIGTTIPAYKLDVLGDLRVQNASNYFIYDGKGDIWLRYLNRGSGGRAIVHDITNVLTLNYEGDFWGGTKLGVSTFFAANAGNSYINTGNVGIGTTSPDKKLDVIGTIAARNGNIYVQSPIGGSAVAGLGELTNALSEWPGKVVYGIGWAWGPPVTIGAMIPTGETFGIYGWTGNANFKVTGNVDIGGKVGIGTPSPQGALDVVSTTGALIVPRMNTAQRDALSPKVEGMIIYNTTTRRFNFWEVWQGTTPSWNVIPLSGI